MLRPLLPTILKIPLLTGLALLAFAGNSILCRLALNDSHEFQAIDAGTFTAIRLISGSVFLLVLMLFQTNTPVNFKAGSWRSSGYLFTYAAGFSFAYITLETGIGALILFGAVQVTMILASLLEGKSLQKIEWLGLITAFFGLVTLLLPGTSNTAPDITGILLMLAAGIAWGLYTLAGRHATDPLMFTTNHFLRTLPFVLVLLIWNWDQTFISQQGLVLAIASGALTSGCGYAIWYSVLQHLSISRAAVVQLSVPIIAAFGGLIFTNEAITSTFIIASCLVLGGILMVILARSKKAAA